MTVVLEKIKKEADNIYQSILLKRKPEITIPIRSLSNVKFNEKEGYFEMQTKEKKRQIR